MCTGSERGSLSSIEDMRSKSPTYVERCTLKVSQQEIPSDGDNRTRRPVAKHSSDRVGSRQHWAIRLITTNGPIGGSTVP